MNKKIIYGLIALVVIIAVAAAVYFFTTQNQENGGNANNVTIDVQASMYLVIQAKDGVVDSVKTKVDNYATSYEQQWERYLPEQYELVKQRKTGVKGNYVYLIISENAAELETLIK